MIHIESSQPPFTSPRVVLKALTVMGRAESMGLTRPDEDIRKLDIDSFRKIVRQIHRAGIATSIRFDEEFRDSVPGLEHTLERLNAALEESPVPEFEWGRLIEVLGIELLARLLGISVVSIRRYKTRSRATPDQAAARLHFLSLIVGDLSGAYNEIGIRQWFDRKRAQLGERSPAELLKGRWAPDQKPALQVRDLAYALVASPAT
jgi:hypothetical protein